MNGLPTISPQQTDSDALRTDIDLAQFVNNAG